jgi:hypothetical protein
MAKTSFKKQYRDLEMSVHSTLREMISKSKYKSKHVDEKALDLKTTSFKELTIINDRLTFLNSVGNHFDIFHVDLENLIEIIEG